MALRDVLTQIIRDSGASSGETARPTLRQLIRAFERENLVLVLGAGVSKHYNIPTWEELLRGLLLAALPRDTASADLIDPVIVAKLFSDVFRPTPLIAARYLRLMFSQDGGSESFEERVRRVLYASVSAVEDSATLREIRQLCVAPSKSPTLDSIITYNFDDILEKCLSSLEIEIPHTSIYSIGQASERGAIPIFHVHGFLPRTGRLDAAHKVTLSEDVYHEQYTDVYSWSNMVQINKFREKSCLFIGISFSDPNLRRLLDIAYKQRGKPGIHHYLLKQRYKLLEVKARLDALPKELGEQALQRFAETGWSAQSVDRTEFGKAALLNEPAAIANSLITLMQRFEERDAQSFGVGIIWLDDHDQIAPVLQAVRKRDPGMLPRGEDELSG